MKDLTDERQRERLRKLASGLKSSDPTKGSLEGVMAVAVLDCLDEIDRLIAQARLAREADARRDGEVRRLREALAELLRVDDEWHGSVNSEMADARRKARAALAGGEGKA